VPQLVGLTNYARENHQGMRISSAPAESAMSHLVNQRMGKRQPMRWSSEGAHLLLQVRCAVLGGRLDRLFPGKVSAVSQSSPPSSTTCRVTAPTSDPVPRCRAALKSENFVNAVGLVHLNRFFRTFGAKVKLLAGHPRAALALWAVRTAVALNQFSTTEG
jgi:hypothetical protein